MLTGFIDSAAVPKVLTFHESQVDPANRTTYTFSGVAIGDAKPDRRVIVGVSEAGGTASSIPTSVTIGGVSASKLTEANTGNSIASIWIALVPTGTTANIVLTLGQSSSRLGIGVWSCTGLESNTPIDTDSDTSVNPQSLSVNTAEGGFAVAVSNNRNNSTVAVTWSAMTERYDEIIEGSGAYQSGADKVTDGSTLTTSVTYTINGITRASCIASF